MGGENSTDLKPKKRLTNNEDSINKGIININNINDNKINNEENENGKIVILETLIRIFCFEEEFKQLCSDKNSSNNDFWGIIIPKKIIENYKKVYYFEYFKQNFSSIILKCITVNKKINYKILNKANLQMIINQIDNDKNFINAIEKIIKNNPLNEIIKEAEWNYKILEITDKKKTINKKFLIDFEIIDYEIFLLLINQKIEASNFLFVDYFIYDKKILVLIKDVGDTDNVFCEVGDYNAKDGIIIESILDTREIQDSRAFKDKSINNEIYINKMKKEINFIEFKNLIAKGLKINYSKVKNWIRKKDKKNIKNNQINSINNDKENFTYNKNNFILKEEKVKPKGDNNDLINKKENEKDINNHEKNDKILPSIQIKNENKDKCININEEEENKEGNKSKRENKINKKALIDLDEYSTQKNLKSDKKIKELEKVDEDEVEEKSNEEKSFEGKLPNEKIFTSETNSTLHKKSNEKNQSEEKLSEEENIKQEANEQEKEVNNNNTNLKNIKLENKINDNYVIENNINNLNNKNLENVISKLLNEQKKLNDKIKDLENKLKEKDDLINDYIETINKLKNSLNENIHQNENLNETLIRKSNEIEELKKEMEQLKIKKFKFPFELSEKEELVSLIITTIDEKINVSFLCKNTDKFIKIEKDFYNKYPQYKNLDNYFSINGNKINPDLSLDENKIKNNDIVVLYQ